MSKLTGDGMLDLRCHCSHCEERTKEVYHLRVSCTNCGWKGIAILRKGDRAGSFGECPHCDVQRLLFGIDPLFEEVPMVYFDVALKT